MKKGKNDEKIMGPMFPRLHVNDTETGGPRAPPRNKMALYEQFSIPSQRNPTSRVPLLNPNKAAAADLSHPASSSRGTGLEKSCSGYSEFSLSSTQQPQQKQQKRSGEEDDFQVPVYVKSMKGQDLRRKKHTSSDPRSKEARNHVENSSTKPVVEGDKSRMMATQGQWNQFKRMQTSDVNLLNESRVYSNIGNSKCTNASDEFISCMDMGYTSAPRIDLSSREQGHVDEASENTMVDSIVVLDDVLSPDDVVAVIGQKGFWKARRQLLNQQRLFAVQVFELHRLIMVQKLIASSPDILLEGDDVYLEKPSEKPSLDFAKQPSTQQKEQKDDDAVEPPEKLDCSSVGKTDPSTLQSQPPPNNNNNTQISVTAPPETTQLTAMGGNNGLNQWPHYQPSGNHWLVPVMSPSEGLIYKPYPIPGYMGHNPHPHPHPHPFGYFPQYVMNQPVIGPTQTIPFHPPSGAQRSASRGSQLLQQVSTASSPDVQVSEGRNNNNGNALPLFPTKSSSTNNPIAARVIKVVPHNARTASESAARIFQSIQQGRK